MDLFKYTYEGYKMIYDKEFAEVGDPDTYERLYNRRKSNGPYGIWGRYLEELSLEIIRYNPRTKTVQIIIGS